MDSENMASRLVLSLLLLFLVKPFQSFKGFRGMNLGSIKVQSKQSSPWSSMVSSEISATDQSAKPVTTTNFKLITFNILAPCYKREVRDADCLGPGKIWLHFST